VSLSIHIDGGFTKNDSNNGFTAFLAACVVKRRVTVPISRVYINVVRRYKFLDILTEIFADCFM
jgi:hypothetical protein